MKTAARYVTVARVGEIAEGGVKIVRVEDQLLALKTVKAGVYGLTQWPGEDDDDAPPVAGQGGAA